MDESTQIQIFSITIILISALVYYFGVLWGHTQAENYNKADCYFASIMFIIKYMLPACSIVLYLQANSTLFQNVLNNSKYVSWIFILLIQVIFLGIVSSLNKGYDRRKKSETYKDEQTFLYLDVVKGFLWGKVKNKEVFRRRGKKCLAHLCLIAISNFTIIIVYILYNFDKSGMIVLLSAGIGFLTLTNIVFSVGHSEAYYPKAKVCLKGEKDHIEGNILKYGEYICFLTNDKTCLINRDDISYIEYI